jgi:hypothetical protein
MPLKTAFDTTVAPGDAASREITEAWRKAYGHHADASDAWDHAIKAVEAVLIPIVVPTQAGAHIGHLIGQLDRQGERGTPCSGSIRPRSRTIRRTTRCRRSSECSG